MHNISWRYVALASKQLDIVPMPQGSDSLSQLDDTLNHQVYKPLLRSLGFKPELGKLAWNLQRACHSPNDCKLHNPGVWTAKLATWLHVLHLNCHFLQCCCVSQATVHFKVYRMMAHMSYWLIFGCNGWPWDPHHDFQLIQLQPLRQHTRQPVQPRTTARSPFESVVSPNHCNRCNRCNRCNLQPSVQPLCTKQTRQFIQQSINPWCQIFQNAFNF